MLEAWGYVLIEIVRISLFPKRKAFGLLMVLLAFWGLVGRLVAGSMVVPPYSPFHLPAGVYSQYEQPGCASVSGATLVSAAETTKKGSPQSNDGPSRPWYGLMAGDLGFAPIAPLVGNLAVSPPPQLPPYVAGSFRPPSC